MHLDYIHAVYYSNKLCSKQAVKNTHAQNTLLFLFLNNLHASIEEQENNRLM